MEVFREENLKTLGKEIERKKEEVEDLKVKVLEKKSGEMLKELEETQHEKEESELKRKEAEKHWRSKVEEIDDLKLKDTLRDVHTLKEWRSEEKVDRRWSAKGGEVSRYFSFLETTKRTKMFDNNCLHFLSRSRS